MSWLATQHLDWCRSSRVFMGSWGWLCSYCLKFQAVINPTSAWNSWIAFPKILQLKRLFRGRSVISLQPRQSKISIGAMNRTWCSEPMSSPRMPNFSREENGRFCWSPYLAIAVPEDILCWSTSTIRFKMLGCLHFCLIAVGMSSVSPKISMSFSSSSKCCINCAGIFPKPILSLITPPICFEMNPPSLRGLLGKSGWS